MINRLTAIAMARQVSISLVMIGLFIFCVPLAYGPELHDRFEFPKWALVYVFAILMSFKLILLRGVHLRLSVPLITLTLLVVSYVASVQFDNLGNIEKQVLDWLGFFSITLGTHALYSKNPDGFVKSFSWPILMSALVVTALGVFQYFGMPLLGLEKSDFASSTFGFQNMTAEFIGVAVLVCVYLSMKNKSIGINFFILPILVLYLTTLHCRSVEVALSFAIILMALSLSKKSFANIFPGAAIIMIILCINLAPKLRPPPTLYLDTTASSKLMLETKSVNVQTRLIRWRNTLELIKQNPFGIGPGNYEFGYVSYQNVIAQDPEGHEASVIQSPHNGYLELFAENGWFAGLLFFISLVITFKLLWSKRTSQPASMLFFSLIIYLCVDALFAFPLEIPFPFFISAVILGPILWLIGNERKTIFIPMGIGFVILVVLIIIGRQYVTSKYLESQPDFEKLSQACETFPANWHPCLHKARTEFESSDFTAAYMTSSKILNRFKNHYPALWVKGFSALELGKHEEACQLLRQYDMLFNKRSSVSAFLSEECD